MIRFKLTPTALIVVLLLSLPCAALAASKGKVDNEQAEIVAVVAAKTSLTQAIVEAEKQTGGKALRAGVENQNGIVAYDVKIANGTAVQKVLVDLTTGKVLKIAPDADDSEKDENDDDND